MSPYKDRGSHLGKCLSLNLNKIYQRPIKYPMKCPIYLYNRGPSAKVSLIHCIDFSSWFLTLVVFTSSAVV